MTSPSDPYCLTRIPPEYLIPSAPPGDAGLALEPLARITPASAPRIRCAPLYYAQGVAGALPECWARQTVLAKLVAVSDLLYGRGLTLIVWDAWRPAAVQQALYDGYTETLRAAHPGLSSDALAALVQEFVARPNSDPLRPPPHLTGGAVDVTLGDADGKPLWMGTEYDDFTPRAYTRYFETPSIGTPPRELPLDDGDTHARDRRRILYHAMTKQGFTNYAAEWWHFDYGNRLWAQTVGQPPLYGPAEPLI